MCKGIELQKIQSARDFPEAELVAKKGKVTADPVPIQADIQL